jgi:excisionase family DNA binding protein
VAQSTSATVRPALMNIDQVAERLGVSVRHMRRLVAERRIPFVKWGHLLRFDPDEVDRWIEECAVPASASGWASVR